MNILIDIGHPAHVHLYRHFIGKMTAKGHRIWVTVKNVSSSKRLLEAFNIPYTVIGEKSDSIIEKGIKQLGYIRRLYRIVRENKIDIGVGSSINLAHLSKLTGMKSVIFDDDDDEVEPLFVRFAHPFCDYLLSPNALRGRRKRRDTLFYPGYHELAYLHPRRFTPDPEVLREIGLKEGDPFFIMRFNAFKAHHDVGAKGLSAEQKQCLLRILKAEGQVFITMEKELEPEFEPYRLSVSPEKIHSLLFFARLFAGDSQTMTSEAAIIGTPALKCNSFAGRLLVPTELEKRYQLCFSFHPIKFDKLVEKLKNMLQQPSLKKVWLERRRKMLQEKIDVSAFMVWFVENLHDSPGIMKDNPEFLLKFK